MSRPPAFPNRPRITGSQTFKYLNQNVMVIGEVISITPNAQTFTLKMPDSETIIVLLSQKNSTKVDKHLLTEVAGKLVSKGQIEATHIKQWDQKQSSIFNNSFYVDAANIFDAYANHLNI